MPLGKVPVSQMNVRKRLLFLFIIIVIANVALIGRLAWVQIVRSEELYKKAWEQWNRNIPAISPRGFIYDRNENLLAGSTTVETVVAIPSQIEDARGTALILAPILDMDALRLEELIIRPRASVYLKRRVENETAQRVRELNLPGITFTPESKRFYPGGTLASQIIGFVGTDQGWSGLEIYYEEQLKGRDGRILFPSDARGRQLPHEVKSFIPPQNGRDLILTIDHTIQYIVERELARAMVEFSPKRVVALAVNPMTGEVLAAASKPDFDPADYMAYDSRFWTLGPVTDTFEPGSTLKLATLVAAVEEGLYRENEMFHCTGALKIAGSSISCWRGHGSISFLQAVLSSCNPAFMTLGQRLGPEKFFSYLRAFGYGTTSGIDYPGEGSGIVFSPGQVGPLELATTSFGQGVSVTPLQQVMAVAAIANGGYLMKPYLLKEIRDIEGNVLENTEPQVVRQVMSGETSRQVTAIMEQVVQKGSGLNASIEGYRIAGKTGTAQKVGPDGRYMGDEHILSFLGFVPVDDPQILLYIAVDGATRGSQWGSQVSAPIFHRIMKDVLNYLEIFPRDDGFPEHKTVTVPDLVGLSADEAGARLDSAGLLLRLVGEGGRIVNQTPKGGVEVNIHTRVIVYLGERELSPGTVLTPDVIGATIKETEEILSWAGLKLQVEGSGIAVEQYPRAGIPVNQGAPIKVVFRSLLEIDP